MALGLHGRMAVSARGPLTDRQREILSRVVEEYVASGRAGRIAGARRARRLRRLAVDRAGRAGRARAARAAHASRTPPPGASRPRPATGSTSTGCSRGRSRGRRPASRSSCGRAQAEVDDALQATTEILSQVTRLLALVSAPPLEAATVRHVDVLQLQPNVVVVVVITSAGEVTKQRYTFPEPVDPGLVTWAGDYLRERVTGAAAALAAARARLRRAGRRAGASASSWRVIRRVFDELEDERELYVGGAAGLLDDLRSEEIGAYRSLIDALEKRAALLDVLAQSSSGAAGRSSASATSSRSRGCTRSRSSARPTATPTSPSGRSACSGRSGWTTRRRCARSVPRRTSSRASSRRSTPRAS